MENMDSRLNLGAGNDIKEGWINHDLADLPGIDKVHDLRVYPWPWEEGTFKEVFAKDILEHVPDLLKVVEEIHRICKPGAKIQIAVPYWNSYESITDPTHRNYFNEFTFDFFDPTKKRCRNRPYYSHARFKIKEIGFGVKFLAPYVIIPYLTRYIVVKNKTLKWILGFLASHFNNIIIGLEFELERI